MKIVYMGTPDFAVPVLRAIAEAGHEVGMVITQPDRKRNRGKVTFSPVKNAALELGIPVLQPERLNRDEEAKAKLKEYAPDAFVVTAYGQILSREVLDIPRLGCYNVHASLLPQLRGAAPMQHAILQGLEKTGVTIMKMDEGMDTGDIAAFAATSIGRKNFEQLHDTLAAMGADLIVEELYAIEHGEADFVPQGEEGVTYAPRLSRQDGKIDFSRTAEQIDRQIRAFDPWPGAFCRKGEDVIKFWCAEAEDEESGKAPGTVLSTDGGVLRIACGKGTLAVTELQAPGKKRMLFSDYLRGHPVETGTVLE